ncbi:hypothetical protein M569_07679 [Genlisea aurea]|uniref:Uncharacterized protein n=1 Tax=Genlisea aurea TaxID=192259 RepID=S8CQE8_9LAMI|nr:hypothetical protein M569_07679 [Genlisea aurea]
MGFGTKSSQSEGQNDDTPHNRRWAAAFKDPDMQRKKRVASYKVYTVEGKIKGSIKRTLRNGTNE